MSKLCQCRLEKLEKKYWEHVAECSLMDCVAEGNMILIQDCVCEKKEDRCDSCLNKTTSSHLFTIPFTLFGEPTARTVCNACFTKKVLPAIDGKTEKEVLEDFISTKQSQSPCEHEWQQLFFNMPVEGQVGIVRRIQLPSWGCFKPVCGLVTCKNPNDK